MIKTLAIFFLFFSTTALAGAEGVDASSVGKLFGGLLVVVAVIFWGAWLAKKLNLGSQFSNNDSIKIISLLSLGAKEKIIILDVAGEQIVIGSSAQGLQHLHTLKTPIEINKDGETSKSFSSQLKGFMSNPSAKKINLEDDL